MSDSAPRSWSLFPAPDVPPSPDAAPSQPQSTPYLPASRLVGQELPSGLRVLARLLETSEGTLYSGGYRTGREVSILVPLTPAPAPGSPERSAGPALFAQARLRAFEERVGQLKRIHHPNVLEVYGTDLTPDGRPCAVLEPLTGELLAPMLAVRGHRPMPQAMELCLQACAGLEAAHAEGVVHGNLSPESIAVAWTVDGHPRVTVMGFGLGLLLTEARPDRWQGNPYISPEQLCGVAANVRTDEYSIAAVFHHLLTGAPPGVGAAATSLPGPQRAVLIKALAEVPSQRFPSIPAFVEALERAQRKVDRDVEMASGLPNGSSGMRPRLLGVAAMVMVAVGAWLFWGWRRQEMNGGAGSGGRLAEQVEADDGSSALLPTAALPARSEPEEPPGASPAPAKRRQRVADFSGVAGGSSSALDSSATSAATRDKPLISPYRRSHPWAAAPGGRYYYRSSCPEALEFEDLVFFTTEEAAVAAGFVPTPIPGCR